MNTTKIVVEDPGYRDGKIVPYPSSTYDIKIKRVVTADDGTMAIDELIQVITVYPYLRWVAIGGYAFISLIILSVAFFFGGIDEEFGWGSGVIALWFLYFALNFSSIKEDERGVLLLFGRPVGEVTSGFVFLIRGILELKLLPRRPVQIQYPNDPEKVYKGHDKVFFTLPIEERGQYALPIRATTGRPRKEDGGEESGILDSQMTLEVTFYVRWTIEQFWVFLIRIGSVEEQLRQLRDSGERVLIQEIARRTPAKVIEELSEINEALRKVLEGVTEDSGVRIDEAAMLSPDLNHEVNVELRNVVTAKARAAQTVIGAEAAATQTVIAAKAAHIELTEEGAGVASAKKAELRAMAAGAKALGVKGQDIIDLEKTRAMAAGKATIIVDGGNGASSLVGLGTRFGIGMNEASKKVATTETQPT